MAGAALGLDVTEDERLIEFGSGAVSPFTLAEMLEHLPYDDVWHPDDPGYDGETVGAFWRRTAAAAEEILAGRRPAARRLHGGTTTAILRWALGIAGEVPDAFHFYVANASLTDLRLAPTGTATAAPASCGSTNGLPQRRDRDLSARQAPGSMPRSWRSRLRATLSEMRAWRSRDARSIRSFAERLSSGAEGPAVRSAGKSLRSPGAASW